MTMEQVFESVRKAQVRLIAIIRAKRWKTRDCREAIGLC